ncbi:DUF3304 domain-containing protein [Chromobacterium haemolyticum]|nr:DUF3304 domain-containing protein [Chromobacterium haemolyticum]
MLLPAQAMGNKPSTEMVPAGVEGYNHTSANINRFSVNRAGGHNIAPFNSYGGSQSCCVSLPRQWRPGLMATVEWEKDPNPRNPVLAALHPNSEEWGEAYKLHAANYTNHRAVVEIPRYEKSGAIKVHFLPCDQVKVAANNITPGYPGYPYNFPARMQEPKTCPK